jgi:hypothetical protein
MDVTIDPIADQLAQWMDHQVCTSKPSYLAIGRTDRYFAALRCLKRLGIVESANMGMSEHWYAPKKTWQSLQLKKFTPAVIRIVTPERGVASDPLLVSQFEKETADVSLDLPMRLLEGLLTSVERKELVLHQYDSDGTLTLCVTSKGSRRGWGEKDNLIAVQPRGPS